MIQIKPKKNIILFSIDYRRADLYQTYGGFYPSPNMERMANKGILFREMRVPSASTVMSLSSLINGKFCHEMNRFNHREADPYFYRDNLFSRSKKAGRRNFLFYNEESKPHTVHGIYGGEDAERVLAKNVNSTLAAAKFLVKYSKKLKDPFLFFFHICVYQEPESKSNDPRKFAAFLKNDDNALGILLDNFNLDETTIVFTSDHGFLNGEHKHLFSHSFFLYEPILKVPCLVTSDEKHVVSEPFSLTQLLDLLAGKSIEPTKTFYAETQYKQQPHRITSIIEEGWKYIAHYSPDTAITGRQEELYDLATDPNENRNLLHDISRHPLQMVHHKSCVAETGHYAFQYDMKFLDKKIEMMRKKMCRVWQKDFISVVNKLNPPGGKKLIDTVKTLEPKNQLALISDFMQSIKPKKLWYSGGWPIPKGRVPQPPFGFPGFPKSFLEYKKVKNLKFQEGKVVHG